MAQGSRLEGCAIRDIAGLLRTPHSTAARHVERLAKAGRIAKVRDGREVRLFLGKPDPSAYLHALLRDPRKRKVAGVLCLLPVEGMSLRAVAKAARMPLGSVKRTLEQFHAAGLVGLERQSRRCCVQPTAAFRTQAAALLGPAGAGRSAVAGQGRETTVHPG